MAVDLGTLFADPVQLEQFKSRFYPRLKPEGGCLVWTGAKTPKGYGVVGFGPRGAHHSLYTHRVAHWLATGGDASSGQ